MRIHCLIVEVLENTAVHIDCLTARVTAAFSFCERRGWEMAMCTQPLRYKYCWFSTICFKT